MRALARARKNAAMDAEKPASIFRLDSSSKLPPASPPALMSQKRSAVVLDTNVVLDWLVFRDARVVPLVAAIQGGRVQWLACAAMREELAHMLGHRTLASWTPDPDRALAVFDSLSIPRDPPPPTRLKCSDADDQVFVDLAVATGARWLVTHDRALLSLARRARAFELAVVVPTAWRENDTVGSG